MELALLFAKVVEVISVTTNICIGRDQEASGASCGILNGLTGLRLEQVDDAINQWAWGKVLAGTALGLAGIFLK